MISHTFLILNPHAGMKERVGCVCVCMCVCVRVYVIRNTHNLLLA